MANHIFIQKIEDLGIKFISGVPDSLLSGFTREIENGFSGVHLSAPNEGAAIGLAMGNFFASGRLPLVYMQNSGIGNALNPLVSLASRGVFQVPMLLLIGWRGEIMPNREQLRDEPQHMLQGLTTEKLLESVHIPYEVGDNLDGCIDAISRLHAKASNYLTPTALLIRKRAFEKVSAFQAISETAKFPSRASYIRLIADVLPKDVALVATTGKISRELEVATRISGGGQTLLVVGGMGHALAITAGIATASSKKVLCLDGDGAFLMHLGTGFVAAEHSNLIHVVLNNGCHESVGGQPTVAKNRTLRRLGQAMGYSFSTSVKTLKEFQVAIRKALDIPSSSFIEVRCSVEDSNSLPRPIQAPLQNRKNFMDFLGNG